MSALPQPCPSCRSEATRPLTRKEWKERNGGEDRLVVVLPLLCPACGHVWDAPLSSGACYLVVTLSAIGFLIGAALFVGGVWLLIQSKLMPLEGANNLRNQIAIAGVALTGLAIATGAAALFRKYLRLACER